MGEWSELVEGALAALPRSEESVRVMGEAGLSPPEWSVLVVAHLCEPPAAFEVLADWVPYASAGLLRARVDALLARGLLQEVVPREYVLTDAAVELLQRWIEHERSHLAQHATLPTKDLESLAVLLRRVVEAALAAPPPPDKMRLLGSRRIAPVADAPPMVRIDQYLSDLHWFRDDAHVAAWREHGFDGPSIEVLTLLWREGAKSLDSVGAALSERRGYSRDDYSGFVQGLVERGLVEAGAAQLTLTPAGQARREEVEATTESYYMFPWTVLLPVELKKLRSLLEEFTQAPRGP